MSIQYTVYWYYCSYHWLGPADSWCLLIVHTQWQCSDRVVSTWLRAFLFDNKWRKDAQGKSEFVWSVRRQTCWGHCTLHHRHPSLMFDSWRWSCKRGKQKGTFFRFICLVLEPLCCATATWSGSWSVVRCAALCGADAHLAQGPFSRGLLFETAQSVGRCSACLRHGSEIGAGKQGLGQRDGEDREVVARSTGISGADKEISTGLIIILVF